MKKLFNIIKARSAAESTNSSQANSAQLTVSYSPVIERIGGLVDLALLQFFLNHSEKVVYDPEPLFRSYFETCLSNNCKYTSEKILKRRI